MNDKAVPPVKPEVMDYAQLLNTLEKASAFDLFRLQSVIHKELESSHRLNVIKAQLTVGQQLAYFDSSSNNLHPCEVVQLKQNRVLVKDLMDGREWLIRYYMLNIEGVDCKVNHKVNQGLSRHSLSVNDVVGFKDKEGVERVGKIIRLNPKSVTLICAGEWEKRWRVSYALLHQVFDGEARIHGDASYTLSTD